MLRLDRDEQQLLSLAMENWLHALIAEYNQRAENLETPEKSNPETLPKLSELIDRLEALYQKLQPRKDLVKLEYDPLMQEAVEYYSQQLERRRQLDETLMRITDEGSVDGLIQRLADIDTLMEKFET